MKLYNTPGGYQTIHNKPLFPGACEECLGDCCYLHPLAGRVTCLRCDGWGSEEARIKGEAKRRADHKKEVRMFILSCLSLLFIPVLIFLAISDTLNP